MDYEKAYKKARSIAEIFAREGKISYRFIETVFPELIETEEDIIIGEIIEFIEFAEDCDYMRHDFHQKKRPSVWIEWLEKQKDNPKNADSISADCTSLAKCEDRDSKYGVFPEDVIVVARACEKLEAHGYPELAHALKNVNLYTKEQKPVMGNGISEQTKMNETVYKFTPEEWKKALDEQLPKEQKHVEVRTPTDEEIEEARKQLHEFKVFVVKMADKHQVCFSYDHDFEWDNFCGEILYYLNGNQKPVEWSGPKFKPGMENVLKSLRPSWKPSEEQMRSLEYFIKLWGDSDEQRKYTKVFNDVKSLYEQLKKL